MDDPPDPSASASAPADPVPPPAGPTTTTPEPPAGPLADRWQLRRSVRDRKLKGVAGGVAAAADVDATLIRLLFAVAAFSGWGIVAYIVLAVVLRDETADDPARPLLRDQRRILRIGLAVAAAIAVGRLFDGWFVGGGDGLSLPFVLIAVGAAVLWARRDQPPADGRPPTASNPLGSTTGGGGAGIGADPAGPDMPPGGWPPPPPPFGAGIDWRSTGTDLLRLAAAFVAVGAFLVLLGGGFLVAVGAVSMRLPFLPAALGGVALLGLVIAVVRRARPAGLLVSGGALVAAAALAVGLTSFPGGAGTRVVVIGPGTPLLDRYEHSAGRLVLDLRDLTLEPGSERRVVAKVGTGQLTVIVPSGLTTDVKAQTGAGTSTLFGREQSGAGLDVTSRHAGAADAGRLVLDLDVGVGEVVAELPPKPTYEVACQVPAEAEGDGTDAVTCPHPTELVGKPMTCSVSFADVTGGRQAGHAFCREAGDAVPRVAFVSASCAVPSDSDAATCGPLTPAQHSQLQRLRGPRDPGAPPSVPAPPGPAAPLTCGPPGADGLRTCTTTPAASTSTTAATTYRCTEDPTTGQLTCQPA